MGHSQKNKKRMKIFKETGDTKCIYRNEIDKAPFQHYMAYGDFKDLWKRAASDENLRTKAFNIAEDSMYDGYQRCLASLVLHVFW